MKLITLLRRQTASDAPSPRRRRWRSLALVTVAIVLVIGGMAASFSSGALLTRNGTVNRVRVWAEVHTSPGYWQDIFSRDSLPTLTVNMSFRNLQKIEAKRQEALERGTLQASVDDFVPAQLQFNGQTISAEMRLKGDGPDHWSGDKWSFRIKIGGDDQLLGMRRFSIQNPPTRNYLFEWGYLEHLRNEGVLAPRYEFINVVFNGDKLGIYAVEEHFSKELLESQARREGVIIRFNENRFWAEVSRFGSQPGGNVANRGYTVEFIDAFRDGYIENSPELIAQRDAAIGLLRGFTEGKLAISEVFDAELMGRFLAVSELWDAWHAVGWRQLRFYYNTLTAKLEPVGFDAQPPDPSSPRVSNSMVSINGGLTERLILDPVIGEVFARELNRMSTPDYLDRLKDQLAPEFDSLTGALFGEFGYLPTPWDGIKRRQRIIELSLSPTVNVFASTVQRPAGSESDAGALINVEVRNILVLPVEVLGFRVDGGELIPAIEALAEPDSETAFVARGSTVVLLGNTATVAEFPGTLISFQVPIGDRAEIPLQDPAGSAARPEIEIITGILGLNQRNSFVLTSYPSGLNAGLAPAAPSIEDALAAHPFLEVIDGTDDLAVLPGEWEVSGDLSLPQGSRLTIGPGTTLLFEPNAILSASAPLDFVGTLEAPIVLGPRSGSWGGIAVLQAKEPSNWNQVTVKATSSIARGAWTLTGGVTFFESPVVLQNCRFTGSLGEDALNIIRSHFQIQSCEFDNAASDGFDGDFVSGTIVDSSFHDIGDDAIDFSGSSIQITNVIILRVGDKGISAGEASNVVVADLDIRDANIAIASKDQSHVTGERISISGAQIAGLAAYTKKPEFGPGSMELDAVEFIDSVPETLIARGSWIDVNGSLVSGKASDEDALTAAGILGN